MRDYSTHPLRFGIILGLIILSVGGNIASVSQVYSIQYITPATSPQTRDSSVSLSRPISRLTWPYPATMTSQATEKLPILVYHNTPADFESQLLLLKTRGYTTVTFAEAIAGWHHVGMLPAKPVIITFDDGFADQIDAFHLLQKYNMKATFYIINGSAESRWCIGASRRYNDPLQPPEGCGDAYLNWNQIKMLDASGLITIGGHTVDHADLPTLSRKEQLSEIAQGKSGIEAQLGHPIADFAYPYGDFNAETVGLVHQAGYESAVTTLPGVIQRPNSPYTLTRVRDASSLF
jgi:peptidoglycan/xylan/chitin deacetylase (PgdA/CDA1 family)